MKDKQTKISLKSQFTHYTQPMNIKRTKEISQDTFLIESINLNI